MCVVLAVSRCTLRATLYECQAIIQFRASAIFFRNYRSIRLTRVRFLELLFRLLAAIRRLDKAVEAIRGLVRSENINYTAAVVSGLSISS